MFRFILATIFLLVVAFFVLADKGAELKKQEDARMAQIPKQTIRGAVTTHTKLGNGITTDIAFIASNMIKANGYRCDEAIQVLGAITVNGFKVYCDNRYFYLVEDRGGRWTVTID